MRHYAMMNSYATETDDGFANTWYPVFFSSRRDRDTAIAEGIKAARLPLPCERAECRRDAESVNLADMDAWTRRL